MDLRYVKLRGHSLPADTVYCVFMIWPGFCFKLTLSGIGKEN